MLHVALNHGFGLVCPEGAPDTQQMDGLKKAGFAGAIGTVKRGGTRGQGQLDAGQVPNALNGNVLQH